MIEDPGIEDPEKAAVLEPHRARVTWDAVIEAEPVIVVCAIKDSRRQPIQSVSIRWLVGSKNPIKRFGVAWWQEDSRKLF